MKREGLAFLSAIQFLTRLPLPDPGWEPGRLDRAAKFFPLVGGLVGAIAGAVVALAVALGFGDSVALLLGLLAAVLLTGALHEDGLADTADGIGGGRDPARRMQIMKDSNIGSYGALALLFAMALRFALYGEAIEGVAAGAAVLFAASHCVGRAGMLGIVWGLDYARDGAEAKVAPLTARASGVDVLVAAAPLVAVLAVAGAVAGLVLAALAALGLGALFRSRLGGWTGDTAGATAVVCEIAFLMGVAAWS